MNEAMIQRDIKRRVESHSLSFALKYHGGTLSGKGVPDIVGSFIGVPFWVEVKQPGKSATQSQLAWVERCRLCGYVSGVVSGWSEFEELFE